MGSLQVRTFSKTNSIPLMESEDRLRMLSPVVPLTPGLPKLDGIGRKFVRQCLWMVMRVQMCSSIAKISFSLAWSVLSHTWWNRMPTFNQSIKIYLSVLDQLSLLLTTSPPSIAMMGENEFGFMRIKLLCAKREELQDYMSLTSFRLFVDWEMVQYVKSLSVEEMFGGLERICWSSLPRKQFLLLKDLFLSVKLSLHLTKLKATKNMH